jgi:hypothetical protein
MANSHTASQSKPNADLLAGQLAYSAHGDVIPFKLWSTTRLQLQNGEAAVKALAPPIYDFSRPLRSYVVKTGAAYKKGSRMEKLYVLRQGLRNKGYRGRTLRAGA